MPDDFPNYLGDREVAMIDSAVVQLLQARADLRDRASAGRARAVARQVWQVLVPFGDAQYSVHSRHELLVFTLDQAGRIADRDVGAAFARVAIGEALPDCTLPEDVLRRAVELWPQTKRREARAQAVRTLARALDCDRPSLSTMLRQARGRLRMRSPTT